MKKQHKRLTKRQLAVIEDLVSGEIDEPQLIEKHGLTRRLYRMWMKRDDFIEELWLRMGSSHRQSVFILARYAPIAAAKLIGLTDSDKSETVRKACLDIITASEDMPKSLVARTADENGAEPEESGNPPTISAEKASKLLKILSEDE